MPYNKYYKQKKQVSYDEGQTWEDVIPYEYQKGTLYEVDSPDCQPIYRWVNMDISTDWICDGTTKYYKQKKQVSLDEGQTWQDVAPPEYQRGAAYETQSTDCGYVPPVYRWVNMDIDSYYICEPCDGPQPTFKARGYISDGTQFSVDCNDSTLIYSDTPLSAITIEVGDCVSVLDENAFKYADTQWWPYRYYPKNFNDVYIPSTINSIPTSAFTNMVSLVSCTLPKTLTSIGGYAFYHCIQLFYIDLWDNITSIGERAFEDCDSLVSVHIPTGLTSISYYCFSKCGGLISVDIPDSVTRIGECAFEACGIEFLTIGKGITYIAEKAFKDCAKLKSVTIYATTPPSLRNQAFYGTVNFPIYVPADSVNAYKTASGWSSYADRIMPIQT